MRLELVHGDITAQPDVDAVVNAANAELRIGGGVAGAIHCLGPVHGRDEPSGRLLADCYRNAVGLADEHQLRSVAFPAISTGAFGYPMREAADVALRTLRGVAPSLQSVRLVRMVLFTQDDLDLHRRVLAEIDDRNQSRA